MPIAAGVKNRMAVLMSEVCVDDSVQEELVLDAWVSLVTLEQVHHFGGFNYEVRVCFAFPADVEKIVLCHVCECLNVRDTGRTRTSTLSGHRVCLNRFCLSRS